MLGAVAACSGSSGEPIAHPETGGTQAPKPVQSTVGNSGGKVTNTEGSGVEIPSGALPNDVDVSVKAAPPTTSTPQNSEPVGTPYVFGPSGVQFAKPVTIVLAFDPSKLPAGSSPTDIVVFTAPDGTSNYQPLKTSIRDATHVAAETTHFSIFVPVIPPAGFDAGATCTPITCASAGGCGIRSNGCGGTIDCGTCPVVDSGNPPDASGGKDAGTREDGGTSSGPQDAGTGSGGDNDAGATAPDGGTNFPDAGPCTPVTCGAYGPGACGAVSDQCGGKLDCGPCPTGTDAGSGGGTSDAGATFPDGGACTPVFCGFYGPGACGTLQDQCGGKLDCGTCPVSSDGGTSGPPDAGADGGTCMPLSCVNYIDGCGFFNDGCGGKLECVQGCDGGKPDQQDGGSCHPLGCAPGACGPQPDGCGGTMSCSEGCSSPDAGPCTPKTCADYPGICGGADDGCGGKLDCREGCDGGAGGGGGPIPDAGECTPVDCGMLGPQACGVQSNKCGGMLDCGPCAQQDAGPCVPLTCAQRPGACGPVPDGCGGMIDCTTACDGGEAPPPPPPADAGAVCVPKPCSGQCGIVPDGCGNVINCGSCGP
jgi:hypothetical protein